MAHKYAHIFAAMAERAKVSETPWDVVEVRVDDGAGWLTAHGMVSFYDGYEYRLKPRTIKRTIEYPEPCREPLEMGEVYWVVSIDGAYRWPWSCSPIDKEWLAQGRLHKTKENADAHRLALLGGGE